MSSGNEQSTRLLTQSHRGKLLFGQRPTDVSRVGLQQNPPAHGTKGNMGGGIGNPAGIANGPTNGKNAGIKAAARRARSASWSLLSVSVKGVVGLKPAGTAIGNGTNVPGGMTTVDHHKLAIFFSIGGLRFEYELGLPSTPAT